jgi:predicted aspartyl protease
MQRRWTSPALGLALFAALAGAAETITLPGSEIVPPAQIKPDDFVYVAPTRPDHVGRVMAPVYVNGLGPFAFLIDTGASSSVIAPRVVARLALLPDPKRVKLLRGITGSEIVPTVAIDSIAAGGIRLERRELPVVEPRVFANADGIFGADAFAHGCLYVDFTRASVTILKSVCPAVDPHWETLRATLRFGGLVVVKARVGRAQVAAVIDTGAERSLGNPALLAALRLEEVAADPRTRTQVYAATSQAVFGNIVRTPAVRIGTLTVRHVNVVFGDFEVFRMWGVNDEPAIVLGMDVLGMTQALMIDFQKAQVKLLPQGEQNSLRLRKAVTPSRIPQ